MEVRIGIVSVSFLPRLGGAVTQTLLLNRYLRSRGHHVEVFCPDLAKSGRFEESGVTVNRIAHPLIRNFEGTLSRLAIIQQFRAVVRKRRRDFDVFITPEFNIGPLSLCLASGVRRVGIYGADLTFEFVNYHRERIIPYDEVLRGHWHELGTVPWLCTRLLNALQQFMFRRLDGVIVLNPEDLRRISRHTPAVSKIGCLMDAGPPRAELAKKPLNRPALATLAGRAVSWKQIPEAIEVARRLRVQYPELEVHYLGTGPRLAEYERRFAGEVQFHKNLPNHEVLDWFGRSDITINMSDYETFCLTNTEAMLHRSLLLVKPLREYQDYLLPGRNCIAVARPDAPGWLEETIQVFSNGQVRAMVDLAERTIRETYSMEQIGGQIEALLERIAKAAHSPAAR